VCLGVATNTYDAEGLPAGSPYSGPLPSRDIIEQALTHFRGTFDQQPPAYSAKKIDGQRSYRRARAHDREIHREQVRLPAPPALPAPVSVTANAIDVLSLDDERVTLRVDCSAGFYIRSLAHDLGQRLGTGAHLHSLRRTRSGGMTLDAAVPLDAVERDPETARRAVIPMSAMLTGVLALTLTAEGVRRALHGRDVGSNDMLLANGMADLFQGLAAKKTPDPVFLRLLDERGELVAMAVAAETPGLLHPSVVLM
jgi:tRNA pseudouridine55 synthase